MNVMAIIYAVLSYFIVGILTALTFKRYGGGYILAGWLWPLTWALMVLLVVEKFIKRFIIHTL